MEETDPWSALAKFLALEKEDSVCLRFTNSTYMGPSSFSIRVDRRTWNVRHTDRRYRPVKYLACVVDTRSVHQYVQPRAAALWISIGSYWENDLQFLGELNRGIFPSF